jgi:hypothetical protein
MFKKKKKIQSLFQKRNLAEQLRAANFSGIKRR